MTTHMLQFVQLLDQDRKTALGLSASLAKAIRWRSGVPRKSMSGLDRSHSVDSK
jgi:hypothetical protein